MRHRQRTATVVVVTTPAQNYDSHTKYTHRNLILNILLQYADLLSVGYCGNKLYFVPNCSESKSTMIFIFVADDRVYITIGLLALHDLAKHCRTIISLSVGIVRLYTMDQKYESVHNVAETCSRYVHWTNEVSTTASTNCFLPRDAIY